MAARINSFAQYAGFPDSTFGDQGIVISDIQNLSSDIIFAVAIQEDGKIIAAGNTFQSGGYDIAVTRYNTAGALDTSFGTGGIIINQFANNYNGFARAVAIQGDGKILVAGWVVTGTGNVISLLRLNSNGTLDTGFGTAGVAFTEIDNSAATTVSAMAIQDDGKIVLACTATDINGSYINVLRYSSNGYLDDSFGQNGLVVTNLNDSTSDQVNAMLIQPDGKILIAGASARDGDTDIQLLRYQPDGNLDNSFGNAGVVILNPGNGIIDIVYAVDIQEDGKIVAASLNNDGFNNGNVGVIRFNLNGSLDDTFGNAGVVILDLSDNSADFAKSVKVQTDGKIIVSGYLTQDFMPADAFISRLNSDGNVDPAFAFNGILIQDIGGLSNDGVFASAVQQDGRILLAGTSDNDFMIMRVQSDALLVKNMELPGFVDLKLFPNPASSITFLDFYQRTSDLINIQLVDVMGNQILSVIENRQSTAGLHREKITLPDYLSSGIYFLHLSNSVEIKILKLVHSVK